MFKWFSGLKIWLIAIATTAFTAMVAYIKYLSRKNEKLEHDAKIHDELKAIREQQDIDEKEVLDNEPEEIKQEIKDRSSLSKRDRFSKL